MTNRLKELEKSLPKSKKSIDNLIDTIASWDNIIEDEILNESIIKMIKKIEGECKNDCR